MLSRYLYSKSDIKLSIYMCLFLKKTNDELYFWVVEWCETGWEIFSLIWDIYYH